MCQVRLGDVSVSARGMCQAQAVDVSGPGRDVSGSDGRWEQTCPVTVCVICNLAHLHQTLAETGVKRGGEARGALL